MIVDMKNRIGVIILALVCIGLGFALIVTRKQATERDLRNVADIESFSNRWVATSSDLNDKRQAVAELQEKLDKTAQALGDLTNSFTRVSGNLSQANSSLSKTEATLKATEDEVKKRDTRIGELENQNQTLDKQAADLSTAITNLTVEIAETQRKLFASEGDKAFLQKELKRLMQEKAELERQFNDLTVLRAQVSKLKKELSIARRIEWIRRGLFAGAEEKGAQRLMRGGGPAPRSVEPPTPTYDLNVEVTADGGVRVIPPLTNAPASTNPPSPP